MAIHDYLKMRDARKIFGPYLHFIAYDSVVILNQWKWWFAILKWTYYCSVLNDDNLSLLGINDMQKTYQGSQTRFQKNIRSHQIFWCNQRRLQRQRYLEWMYCYSESIPEKLVSLLSRVFYGRSGSYLRYNDYK